MENNDPWKDSLNCSEDDEVLFQSWVNDCIENAKKELKLSPTAIICSLVFIIFKELNRIRYNIL